MKVKKKIEDLLQEHYCIIDYLPGNFLEGSPGQYSAVKEYFNDEERFSLIKQKHINLVLRLNCFMDISIDNGITYNPSPDVVDRAMRSDNLFIMMNDAMMISEPDGTQLTVFNADEKLLELIKVIAFGEGLFVWTP